MTAIVPHDQLWLLDGLIDPARGPANPAGRGTAAALSPQQMAFVDRYLTHWNATRAAVEAGYSQKTAQQQGSRLLSNVVVVAELRRRGEEARRMAQLSIVGVLEQLRRLAYADVRQLYDENGLHLPPHKWPADIAARVAGVETEELFEGRGEERRLVGEKVKVKLWNPDAALDKICRYLGMIAADPKRGGMSPEGAVEADFEEMDDDELRGAALAIAQKAGAA